MCISNKRFKKLEENIGEHIQAKTFLSIKIKDGTEQKMYTQ